MNKKSFIFWEKIVFQVTKTKFCMKVIRIFSAQPVKIPYFIKHGDPNFLLHFSNVHIVNVDYAKFQKSLIVEQFQGNYLKI